MYFLGFLILFFPVHPSSGGRIAMSKVYQNTVYCIIIHSPEYTFHIAYTSNSLVNTSHSPGYTSHSPAYTSFIVQHTLLTVQHTLLTVQRTLLTVQHTLLSNTHHLWIHLLSWVLNYTLYIAYKFNLASPNTYIFRLHDICSRLLIL